MAFDLFGDPVLPPRGPGRPAHVPTAETRAFVNMQFVCGRTPAEVWAMMGLGKTAFYEHYRAEITARKYAYLKFRGRQLMRLNRLAEAGNVAAEKALAGMIQAEQIKATSDAVRRRGASPAKAAPAPVERLGKKEQAKRAAHGLTGRCATRTPPPLLIQ